MSTWNTPLLKKEGREVEPCHSIKRDFLTIMGSTGNLLPVSEALLKSREKRRICRGSDCGRSAVKLRYFLATKFLLGVTFL
jgi:hypothetical protein